MDEDNRLAVGADLRLAVAEHPRPAGAEAALAARTSATS